jgi:hypothetical protein
MPARAYIRVDPHVYDRKVLGVDEHGDRVKGWEPYPADALVAFFGVLALADTQPERGTFRSERILRELLRGAEGLGARYARQVPTLIARGDLVAKSTGRLYVDGWNEWQEGDLTVAERMRRYREKQRNGVTLAVTPTVTAGRRANAPAGVARERSAEAEAEALSGGGGGDAVTRTDRGRATDDDLRRAIAANRRLLASPDASVQRAALRALRRLDPEGEYEAPPASAARPRPAARPRGASA